MSGGPPHHPHNRPLPAGNTAWNHHLQVPNFFPRQPQHAHMSSEHPIMHQPTWHTPTTEPLKSQIPHSHLINLEQMLSERPYLRQSPGVDLTLSRSSSQNGDLPTPISLSVRDTNKINSLAASALERQGELKPLSPLVKSAVSPKPTSPPAKAASPPANVTTSKPKSPTPDKQLSPKMKKVKRVDSILERLNPQQVADSEADRIGGAPPPVPTGALPAMTPTTAAPTTTMPATNSSHDENSNSSSILNVPTPREEDVVSPYSNEDSLDSNKSRRKRKPAKTMKVTKEAEVPAVFVSEPDTVTNLASSIPPASVGVKHVVMVAADAERTESKKTASSPKGPETPQTRKTRRKTSSEDETIDKIAAMVGNIVTENKEPPPGSAVPVAVNDNALGASTLSTAAAAPLTLVTAAQKKDFVAVEDKLEEMFAGLDDTKDAGGVLEDSGFNNTTELLNLAITPSTSQDKVSSTSNDVMARKKPTRKKRKLKGKGKDSARKKKKIGKGMKVDGKKQAASASKKMNGKAKMEAAKDVYAYDSGSNASSNKSRGPFVHINGPRDSPISVSVVNTPIADDDGDTKKVGKSKKFHDDTEFRQKVRSRGLHCSTLSNKYDAQTKDASWICAFCKRGPYTSEFADNDAYYTPGDLFGPYLIGNATLEYARRMDDPFDKSFKSKKVARSLDAAAGVSTPAGVGRPSGPGRKASKRKISDTQLQPLLLAGHEPSARDVNFGITQMDEKSFEVWAHEDCIVWAPGIYLVGSKIVGLEEAVWTASNVGCARCQLKGANICCLKRGCTCVMHLGCAYVARWRLDDASYRAFCAEHATPT